ncbi:nucleolin 2 [Senna tora]|uniref:Nucleolin 2 n=1 Tax=Senna tora TaxID=362788 RepID=A0A834T0B1_9FABA|nr:nucleolin 2 [Senna tora]
MVLSNKKLKQKVRAELAQSQAENADLTPQPHASPKNLLDSSTSKLRLSKREKRRKVRSLNRMPKKKKAKTAEKSGANPGDDKLEASELNQSNSSEQNGDDPTKVYVGGIPFIQPRMILEAYFEGCGTIIEVDAMKFPESGKFRGIAIISFKTEAAAKRALALDGSDMGGLFLKIQPYKTIRIKASDFTPKRVEGYNRIYVGNLPWDTTEDQLRNLLSNCSISSIRFGTDKGGYAHVDFTDSQSMKRALTMDQKILCGRPVRISCAVPLKKAKSHAIDMPTATELMVRSLAPLEVAKCLQAMELMVRSLPPLEVER